MSNKNFSSRVRIGSKGEATVSRHLTSAGYKVENLNESLKFGANPSVDLLITEPVIFAVEVKVRITRNRTDLWLPTKHIPLLYEFQNTHHIPVILILVIHYPHYIVGYIPLTKLHIIGQSCTGVSSYFEDNIIENVGSIADLIK